MANFGKFIPLVVGAFEAIQSREKAACRFVKREGEGPPFAFEEFKGDKELLMRLDQLDVTKAAKLAAFFDHCALTFSVSETGTFIPRPKSHLIFSNEYYMGISVPKPSPIGTARVIPSNNKVERARFCYLYSLPIPSHLKCDKPATNPELHIALKAAGFAVRGCATNASVVSCQLLSKKITYTRHKSSMHRIPPPFVVNRDQKYLVNCSIFPPASALVDTETSQRNEKVSVPCYVCGGTMLRPWKLAREAEGILP